MLSGAAKKLVTVFIVLGVLFAIGQGVVQATVTGKAVTAAEARSQLQADVNPLNADAQQLLLAGAVMPDQRVRQRP